MPAINDVPVIARFRFLVWLAFALLLGCVVVGCRRESATKNATITVNAAHHSAHSAKAGKPHNGARSAWNTLRATLRSSIYDDASRRTIICDDDDDDDDDDDIATSLSSPTRLEMKNAGEKRATNEFPSPVLDAVAREGDVNERWLSSDGLIRAARGYGSGTERPPRA